MRAPATTMTLLTEFGTKKGDRIGDHKINALPPVRADKLCTLIKGRSCLAVTRWRVVRPPSASISSTGTPPTILGAV